MNKLLFFCMMAFGCTIALGAAPPQSTGAGNACWIPPIHEAPEKKFDPKSILTVKETNDLPKILGPLRDHWVAAYETGSPQVEDIRAVTYDPESQAIVAYTGCPTDKDGKGYPKDPYPSCETVEVMQFKYPSEEIELSVYHLPGRNFKNLPVKPEGPNPKQCLGCHSKSPQARWEPYNSWPGFFGSRSRQGEDVIVVGSKEHQKYQAFIKRIFAAPKEHARYTGLHWRLEETTRPQFADDQPSGNAAKGKDKYDNLSFYESKGIKIVRVSHSGTPDPGGELNVMLSEWRGRRIARGLTQSPLYPAMRYALAAVALGCNEYAEGKRGQFPVTKFLPKELATTDYDKFKKKAEDRAEREAAGTIDSVNSVNPFPQDRNSIYRGLRSGNRTLNQASDLGYLWQAAGRGLYYFNNGVEQKWNFNDGRDGVAPVFRALRQYYQKCDPEFKELLKSEPYFGAVSTIDVTSDDEKAVAANYAAFRARCEALAKKGAAAMMPVAKKPLTEHRKPASKATH